MSRDPSRDPCHTGWKRSRPVGRAAPTAADRRAEAAWARRCFPGKEHTCEDGRRYRKEADHSWVALDGLPPAWPPSWWDDERCSRTSMAIACVGIVVAVALAIIDHFFLWRF